MNDVEELLREEMRARVAAAEARQADETPLMLLGRLDRRIRRARLRRRWGTAGLSAVAIGVAIALPLALFSPGYRSSGAPHPTVPLTDTAATPSGWAPVAYGNAQISVPADWRVSRGPVCEAGGRIRPRTSLSRSGSIRIPRPRCGAFGLAFVTRDATGRSTETTR